MSEPKLPITVVIPVRNEAHNIARCLARLGAFEQVVVVDSSSTDRTADIARAYGASVINFEWTGRYPKKRNWFLLNHAPATEWVLFLDADELIGEDFVAELRSAIARGGIAGYWIQYTIYFLGRQLNHGLPQRKLALFRTGQGLFERIEERRWSNLDMEVHEHPVITGAVSEISARVDHNDDRGIRKFVERHTDYAAWEAGRYNLLQTASATSAGRALTQRQRAKYRFIRAWWYPAAYFLYTYVVRRGFLDGWAGLVYAAMKFWYFTLIQAFIADPYRPPEDPA